MSLIDPATEQPFDDFPDHARAEIQSRLAQAAAAFLQWRSMPIAHRATRMHALAGILRARLGPLSLLMTREMGKPITAAEAEIEKCAECCEHFAAHAERYLTPLEIPSDATRSYVRFEPLGAVLAIMPWNFPYWQVIRFAAPALMAGNVGVLKHAPNVPGLRWRLKRLLPPRAFRPAFSRPCWSIRPR